MFFNMYGFTKFVIFVTAPCLFINTILLAVSTYYALSTACLVPCTPHF